MIIKVTTKPITKTLLNMRKHMHSNKKIIKAQYKNRNASWNNMEEDIPNICVISINVNRLLY